eukprot:symbB.v1.2.012249.t1/scaffold842.1/size158541/4
MPTYAAPTASRDKTDEYISDLSSLDPHVRQAACQGLGRDGQRPRVDSNSYVRLAAVTSLGQVCKKGDETALEALIARLGDSDASVRRVACTALAQVAHKASQSARVALLPRCEDRDGGVRRSAVKALEKVAEKDDPQVLQALFARSSDEAFVRFSSVEALSNVSAEGNPEVIAHILELVSDRDARVRCCCVEALGRLATRGDSRVLTALLGCLDDEGDAVRRAAATSLGQVTFAPLQELELQERQIAELEFREQHEVSSRDRTIADLKEKHDKETAELRARVYALEDRLKKDVDTRDAQIAQLKHQLEEKEWVAGVGSVIPHAGEISKFLAKLPELAGTENYGKQITAPIWALRSQPFVLFECPSKILVDPKCLGSSQKRKAQWLFGNMAMLAMLGIFALAVLPVGGTTLSFADVLGDFVVLQQEPAKAAIFGAVNESSVSSVSVSLKSADGKVVNAEASVVGGHWKALLPPQKAGGDWSITATGGKDSIVLKHVTFGDVWYCSGQSNMALQLHYTMSRNVSLDAIKHGKYNNIRIHGMSSNMNPSQPWQKVSDAVKTPGTCEEGSCNFFKFSSTCWYFAESLVDRLNDDRPIGLIHTAWGGSMIEAWLDNKTIASCQNATLTAGNQKYHDERVLPYVNMSLKGWIWYQGENDMHGTHGNSALNYGYGCLMQRLVSSWRNMWSLEAVTKPQP